MSKKAKSETPPIITPEPLPSASRTLRRDQPFSWGEEYAEIARELGVTQGEVDYDRTENEVTHTLTGTLKPQLTDGANE